MSTEPEDLLEEALRGDLPSSDTEARLRRRLLAAGVAIGNGVATGTAAAAGTSATGLVSKAAGLSWGLKLGLVAFVTVPTAGLWLEQRLAPMPAPAATAARPATAAPPSDKPGATPATLERAQPSLEHTEAEPSLEVAPGERAAPEARAPRGVKAGPSEPASTADAQPNEPHPSQADFAATEAPARVVQVGSTLAEETQLLDAAFAALSAGKLPQAAALVREHEARYPNGLLSKERERAKTRLSELSRGE